MNSRRNIGLVLLVVLSLPAIGCKSIPNLVPEVIDNLPPIVDESQSGPEDLEPLVEDAIAKIENRIPAELPPTMRIAYICQLGNLPERYWREEGKEFPMTQKQFGAFVLDHLDEHRWQTVREETVRDIVENVAGLAYPQDLWNPVAQPRLMEALGAREKPFDYALVITLHGGPRSRSSIAVRDGAVWDVQVSADFVRLDTVATAPIHAQSETGEISWSRFDAGPLVDIAATMASRR